MSQRRAPTKVKKLEKENAALRELVRRFRAELMGQTRAPPAAPPAVDSLVVRVAADACATEAAESGATTFRTEVDDEEEEEMTPLRAEASRAVTAALSAWSSEEPLAAAVESMRIQRPSSVPVLDLLRLLGDDLSNLPD
eukprot:TRINITY_DN19179_c0_g1_i1.p1 TRINITY_DN19179_c0_g1~~TRINITY_DN19179_c0_g1_i1.p1  ORF type:complete len:139 (+),score=43.35 TRINITY_DN19179_c0_g1_i1:127-543(+)